MVKNREIHVSSSIWNVNKISFYRFHLTFHENTIIYDKNNGKLQNECI